MKDKSWIKYLVYMIAIIVLVYLEKFVEYKSSVYIYENFKYSVVLRLLPIIIKIGIGVVLGLEYFTRQMKKIGSWKINISKLVFMALPSLYLSISMFIYFAKVPVLSIPLEFLFQTSYIDVTSIFQLIFGYSLVTSFYKLSHNHIK